MSKNAKIFDRVLVMYVGGTLGMKPSIETSAPVPDVTKGRGLQPATEPLYLANAMRRMPELRHLTGEEGGASFPRFDVLEYDIKLDSSLMGPKEWLQIAKTIERYYCDYDGFLIAHGTDTMHFTATALSFLLENLAKPVILTGAMIPLSDPYNDAQRNLIISLIWAAVHDLCEVCVFSNEVLLRGNRSVKVRHTLSAFESPNFPPLVNVGARVEFASVPRTRMRPQPSGALCIRSKISAVVMTVLCHPGFDEQLFATIDPTKTKALILETFGVGVPNGPLSQQVCTRVLHLVHKMLVCVTTSEIHGPLSSPLIRQLDRQLPGAVFVGDMTTECAEVKAMYLFGKDLPLEEVKQQMAANLVGELSPESGAKILGEPSKL